jgi:hypothetical protein
MIWKRSWITSLICSEKRGSSQYGRGADVTGRTGKTCVRPGRATVGLVVPWQPLYCVFVLSSAVAWYLKSRFVHELGQDMQVVFVECRGCWCSL